MAIKFSNKKTQKFYFINDKGKRVFYVLIFGDKINTKSGPAPSGAGWKKVEYRGRLGEMKIPKLRNDRVLEMYFLDVGQGDAAFAVTPNGTKILVDGGLQEKALLFLIWKYQLDQDGSSVTIDHLFLSHADEDHVEGLIPILDHPKITVKNIYHNGIAVYKTGFNTPLGNMQNKILKTLHNSISELDTSKLSNLIGKWVAAVVDSGASYQALDESVKTLNIGDPDILIEILGPRREADGASLKWFNNKAHTINGHSLIFRLVHGFTRTFFSGDLNTKGSKHLLSFPNSALGFDSHIFKSPHHGSHDYYQPLLNAVRPMITVVSSGDSPDHGHPRATFLGGVGLAGRSKKPLIFSTEIAATFSDAGDSAAVSADEVEKIDKFSDLDFNFAGLNKEARRRFKKSLSGIINVRSDGTKIYAARRVMAGYQWESYGPLDPVD